MLRGFKTWVLIMVGCLAVLLAGCNAGSLGSNSSSSSSSTGGLFGTGSSSNGQNTASASLTVEVNPAFPQLGRVLTSTTTMVLNIEVPTSHQLVTQSVSSRPSGQQQFDVSVQNITLFPGGDNTVRVEVFGLDSQNNVNDYAVFFFPIQPGSNFSSATLGPPPQPVPNPFPNGVPSFSPTPSPSAQNNGVALQFVTQPTSTAANQIITPAVQVAVVDANGNTVTNATNMITLAIGANGPGNLNGSPSVTLQGGNLGVIVSAVNGVATFNNLSISTPNTGYTLVAASPGLSGATSQPFNVTAAQQKQPFGVTFDQSGSFLYSTSFNTGGFSIYSFNGTNGSLTQLPGTPLETGSTDFGDICVKTGTGGNPNLIYAPGLSAAGSPELFGFVHNTSTGQVTPIAGSGVTVGAGPARVRFDSTGSFLYVTNEGSSSGGGTTVDAFSVNAATGALTPVPGSPFAGFVAPFGMAAVNSFLYVSNSLNSVNTLQPLNVGGNGALTPLEGAVADQNQSEPGDMTITPNGTFLYVSNQGSNSVSGFRIAGDGSLTPLAGSPTTTASFSFYPVADPGGQFLYVCEDPSAFTGPSQIETFSIVAGTGQLTSVGTAPTSQKATLEIAADPAGHFVAAANLGDSTIGIFSTNNGTLTAVSGSPFVASRVPRPLQGLARLERSLGGDLLIEALLK